MEALSESLLAVLPFLTKAGMDELFLFNILAIFQNCLELEGLKPLKKRPWLCVISFVLGIDLNRCARRDCHHALHTDRGHFSSL